MVNWIVEAVQGGIDSRAVREEREYARKRRTIEDERGDKAFDVLQAQYGDVAGNPADAIALSKQARDEEMAPLEVASKKIAMEAAQQGIDANQMGIMAQLSAGLAQAQDQGRDITPFLAAAKGKFGSLLDDEAFQSLEQAAAQPGQLQAMAQGYGGAAKVMQALPGKNPDGTVTYKTLDTAGS